MGALVRSWGAPPPTPPRGSRGFTLLEVMVAVAILGLGLTAILSAQAGAFSTSKHARSISVATGLARCKMSELEEHLNRDGFQELDESDSGPCCEGDDTSGMRCSWKIEKPQFPEPKYGELNLDTDLSSLGAVGNLAGVEQGKTSFAPDGGVGDIAQALAGGGDPSAAGAVGGITSMAMEMVYPDLKALFEASARRITVTISWTDGSQEHGFDLTQWVAAPQEGAIPLEEEEEEDDPRKTNSTNLPRTP